MVVSSQSSSDHEEVEKRGPPVRSRGSLVSSRVNMFEGSRGRSSLPPTPTRPYHHRTQDSFHTIRTFDKSKGFLNSTRVSAKPNELPSTGYESRQDTPTEVKDTETKTGYIDSRQDSSTKVNETGTTKGYAGSDLVLSGVKQYKKGDLEQALQDFATALKIQRESYGNDHICVAVTLGNLGAVYLHQMQIEEAEKMLKESLDIKQRHVPKIPVSDTLNNLGNCACHRRDYAQGLSFYTSAFEDLKERKGAIQDVANALFNIGRVEIQLRNWSKALKDLEAACILTRHAYGVQHVLVAQTLDLIGYVHLCTQNTTNAMISFTGALAIYRRLYGPISLDVANSLLNVGMTRESKNELAQAREAFSTARDLYERLNTSKDDPAFKATRQSLAKVEEAQREKTHKTLIEKHKQATLSSRRPVSEA